eukprot:13900-Pleurochrysis_carterae.AAC.1
MLVSVQLVARLAATASKPSMPKSQPARARDRECQQCYYFNLLLGSGKVMNAELHTATAMRKINPQIKKPEHSSTRPHLRGRCS